jgi:hypothetical protein
MVIWGNSAAMQVWSIGTLPVPGHKYSTGKVSAASCCRIQVVLPFPGGPATAQGCFILTKKLIRLANQTRTVWQRSVCRKALAIESF